MSKRHVPAYVRRARARVLFFGLRVRLGARVQRRLVPAVRSRGSSVLCGEHLQQRLQLWFEQHVHAVRRQCASVLHERRCVRLGGLLRDGQRVSSDPMRDARWPLLFVVVAVAQVPQFTVELRVQRDVEPLRDVRGLQWALLFGWFLQRFVLHVRRGRGVLDRDLPIVRRHQRAVLLGRVRVQQWQRL